MNFSNIVTGFLQRGIKPTFASNNGLFAQQTRNTIILKRRTPVPLYNKIKGPHKLRPRHFIYEFVENTENRKQKPIDIILTEHVAGIGDKGEKLSVLPMRAYNKFLLPGLAVYASPENLTRYKDLLENVKNSIPEYSSKYVSSTLKYLSSCLLNVIVNQDNPWTLQKFHVRAAFRKINIHVPDHAITLPERQITGPDLEKENKEFYVTVTINKREQIKVRCRLHHYTNKDSEKIPYIEHWKKSAKAIFPEDQPILDSLPKHRLCEDNNVSDA